MTKEQEVIEYFKKQRDICLENAEICDDNNFDEEAICLRKQQYMYETVLNMLKEKDKEIESKNRLLQIVGIELNEAETKIEEKEKIRSLDIYKLIEDWETGQLIPAQKVKDKIEEILNNGEYRIIFEGDAEIPDDAKIINAQKYIKLDVLKELLEGRK